MTEEFLYYYWKSRLFKTLDLFSKKNSEIRIIHPGYRNENSGPDFFNARIQINDTVWAGNVEIHLNSSDWYKHGHDKDEAYNNVILHVVFNHDSEVYIGDRCLPTLELKEIIETRMEHLYEKMMQSESWVPCENQLKVVPNIILRSVESRRITERLNRKSEEIIAWYNRYQSWPETFYNTLAANFGFKVNQLPFRMLAITTPLKTIRELSGDIFDLESLLFGQSGLLNANSNSSYERSLSARYQYLNSRYQLAPVPSYIWKFSRLRPSNFPTIRIAQFAMLINKSNGLRINYLDERLFGDFQNVLQIQSSNYWNNHYTFGKSHKQFHKKLGNVTIDNILINTITPFLYAIGLFNRKYELCVEAVNQLDKLAVEKNSIVRNWKKRSLELHSAMQSQAWIEQYNSQCFHKKCLNCAIGNHLLSN